MGRQQYHYYTALWASSAIHYIKNCCWYNKKKFLSKQCMWNQVKNALECEKFLFNSSQVYSYVRKRLSSNSVIRNNNESKFTHSHFYGYLIFILFQRDARYFSWITVKVEEEKGKNVRKKCCDTPYAKRGLKVWSINQ